jgi:glycerol-3-phosphate dehydrogenase
MQRLFARTLDDLRRRTRIGMGPCQGSTCGPRAAALLASEFGLDPGAADRMIGEFLKEREEGMLPVAGRGGAAQEELNLSARRGLAGGGGVMP